jgi:hypothetical protein
MDWKFFRYRIGICLEGLRRNMEIFGMIAGLWDDI